MKIICAWCDKKIGDRDPFDNPIITHGMCDKCMKKLLKKIKNDIKEFLKSRMHPD